MTRSVPLRHLTVHPPADDGSPPAARSHAAKGPVRPGFAELLRASPRPAARRAGAAAPRADAPPTPEAPQGVIDAIDATPTIDAITAIDAQGDTTGHETGGATDSDPGPGADRFDRAQAATAPPGASEVDAAQAAAPGNGIVRYLAATVTEFCNDPAVHAGDGWTVRLVLDENILPSTTLHLSLSLHWLLLRFDCGDAQSKEVISAHLGTLQGALQEAVVPRRDVLIDFD